ncbi:MAG: hypothetical protein H6981_05880 [Gammaproteobacteria bacterium]|nr:hypothetical protein [Gammaproteobacteria bacterium]MCP5136312.1 hypothetical protein [Gammaproteobacteria bacterium]
MTDKPHESADIPDVPDAEISALFAVHREARSPARAERITAHVRRVAETRNLMLFGTLSLWRVLLEMAAALYVAAAGQHHHGNGPAISKR